MRSSIQRDDPAPRPSRATRSWLIATRSAPLGSEAVWPRERSSSATPPHASGKTWAARGSLIQPVRTPHSHSRVGDWRGGGRTRGVAVGRRLSPAAGASARVVAPFPVAARQTGRAACPHPAFTCVLKPSPSAGRHGGAAGERGRASRKDTRPGIGGTRCLAGRSVASTIVEPAARHSGAPDRRSGAPALG
jgi:hypothetical protein